MHHRQCDGSGRGILPRSPRSAACTPRARVAPIHRSPSVWPFHADARAGTSSGELLVRRWSAGIRRHGDHPGWTAVKATFSIEKGVVVIMSDSWSAMHGPRMPAGRAGTNGRGGSRREVG